MKILILINGWTTKISGGDYHMLKVAQLWSESHEVCLMVPKLGYKFAKHFFTKVHTCTYTTPFERETNNLLKIILLYIFRILKNPFSRKRGKFDVVIASSHFLYDIVPAIIFKKRMKAKFVVYVHHLIALGGRRITIRNIISLLNEKISLLLIKRFADNIFVVNLMTKEVLIRRGFQNEKIFVTSNGLDLEFIDTIQSREREYDACFCGRLVAQKGIFDLLEIWKGVLESLPNAKLSIIGDGPEYTKLKKVIKEVGLEKNIKLLGFLSEEDKIKVFKSSRIFVFPSYEEGWGITVAEAMACGLPVVAYDLPVYKEVFDDKLIMVTRGDKDAMAEQVIFLLNNPTSADAIGEENKKFVRKYDWKTVAEKEIYEIYSSLKKLR